jgi:hypothetical protein
MSVLSPQITVYRLFDLADEVDLGQLELERVRLIRGRGGAVKFDRPPATLDLGEQVVGGRTGRLTARLYEFGVCALRWRVELGERLSWQALLDEADRVIDAPALGPFFDEQADLLEAMIGPALVHPAEERLSEDLAVVLLRGTEPPLDAGALLERPETAALVLGERIDFTDTVRRELEDFAFSYSRSDLAVLGFERVLILDREGIQDVADLVELAHASLIELTYYDRVLRRELEALPQALARRRGFFRGFLGMGHSTLLRRLMERHAEITDVRSRVHGALTVTEDLFYAKIHRRAMALYGATELAETIETRLSVLSDVYSMVSDESGARRAEILEAGILLLVLIEVVRAFL